MIDPVYVEVEGAVATVILNRPDKLNALGLPQWVLIGELISKLHDNDSIRCVIIRGVDERAFSAGADIAGFEEDRSNHEQVRAYGERIDATLTAIRHCQHPVIAAIRGVCVGGGLELASACDLRLCSDTGRFGAPINRLGLTMSYAEVRTLRDLAGTSGALEILLGGDVFDAGRAYELGLVSQVTADSKLLKTVYSLAHRIAERAPLVNRWHKKFVRRLADPAPLTPEELDEGFDAYDTEDYRIGYEAFLAKKKPEFKGR
jgi:enoyl-CoA hydratase/carnithine racemase